MPGLDTNVLVRWLVQDDDAQTARAQRAIETALTARAPLFVPITVLLELEWVLRSRYRFDKTDVIGTVNALLEAKELTLQSEAAVEQALHWFRQGPAEFADCLHAGLCSHDGAPPLLTFDEGAARLPNTRLI